MAITPVKTGNVPTPPPVIKTDAKLTTQFNAAAKAGEAPKPPVVPFYTPEKGSFTESRTLGGKTYKVSGSWRVNEIQTDPKKVFIGGSVTLTDSANNKINWALNSKNSFITEDGNIHYSIGNSNNVHTVKTQNVFTKIKNNVFSALKDVVANKDYRFKDANGNKTAVSLSSAKLTLALNEVGEQNLRYGIGLNGAGASIKTAITDAINNKKYDDTVRKAVKIATIAAGVKDFKTLPSGSGGTNLIKMADNDKMKKIFPLMNYSELSEMNIDDGVDTTIQNIRVDVNGGGPEMTTAELEELNNRVWAHYQQEQNLQPVVDAYVDAFGAPGVLIENGLDNFQRRTLNAEIMTYLGHNLRGLGGQANWRPIATLLHNYGVPAGAKISSAVSLISGNPIFSKNNLGVSLKFNVKVINRNVSEREFARALRASYAKLFGIGTSQTEL